MLVCLFLFVFGSFLSLLCFFFFFFFGVLQVGWDGCVCCFVLFTRGWGRLEPRPLGSSLELYAFYYVASSPGSPLPHLLDGHRKLVGCRGIPARPCPGPVRYPWGSIVELEVPPDKTPWLMTLHPYNTTVLQSTTYAKSPYPPDRSKSGACKPGASGLPYYCKPPVCVPVVLGALTVWRQTLKKNRQRNKCFRHEYD